MAKLKKLRSAKNYFNSAIFNGKNELSVTVQSEPELVQTDFGEKYSINILHEKVEYIYEMNPTTSDFLDSKINGDWKGQKIDLICVPQMVNSKLVKVIYAKGSFSV